MAHGFVIRIKIIKMTPAVFVEINHRHRMRSNQQVGKRKITVLLNTRPKFTRPEDLLPVFNTALNIHRK